MSQALNFLIGCVLLAACGNAGQEDLLRLPSGFPPPRIPAENPLSAAKIELGRFLFYDQRMSGNGTQSCGSCHLQKLAFTDGLPQAVGSTGQVHPRGSMSLANVVYVPALTWANPLIQTLEDQALLPLFGDHPVELGLAGHDQELLARLRDDAHYPVMFGAAFPEDSDPIRLANITKSLATFQRTLISGRSPFDRYTYDKQPDAISASAKRGRDLFFGEKLECFHCHSGFNFSDSVVHFNSTIVDRPYHNTGLYNLNGDGSYPAASQGLFEITGKPRDHGRFRAPSLRNIELTSPYMHDGSIATLEEVLAQHYARGGRLTASGPNAGDGALNPNKDALIRGFELADSERADVIEFLRSLTDREFVSDPRFSNPFSQ